MCKIELNNIYNMDCMEGMKFIKNKSVDFIICDPPYGITGHKWDTILSFEELWKQYNRIIKDNGIIAIFSVETFTSKLIMSNIKNFKYKWIWNKKRGSEFFNVKLRPMRNYEEICIFYKNKGTYNPQFWYSNPYKVKEKKRKNPLQGLTGDKIRNYCPTTISEDGKRYPLLIIEFSKDKEKLHPTQKPIALFEYLIRTYTNENDVVLDNCMGSGTTAVACINTHRNFIGFEFDRKYFEIACARIDETRKMVQL